MKKKFFTILLCLILSAATLVGCNVGSIAEKDASPAHSKTSAETKAAADALKVTVANASNYIFNELYVSPTATNEWGEDHLGSTSILKSNGSFDITLEKYSFDNYDIRVVDEDGDIYEFTYVPLQEGSQVSISFDNDLVATVIGKDGTETVILGVLSSGETAGAAEESVGIGEFTFTLYNESDYDVYAIYMMPAYTDGEGVDILPDVLKAGESYTYENSVAGTDYEGITEWTLHVVDVDGDESVSYDVFDPWQISYVDITWDTESAGYTCQFTY